MAEKVTIMVLKVDLQCSCCYKKVKKLLCKFPQIRDQVYDEKQNTVTITVLCCSPEKIRDKLCCKGGKVIKSIEICSPLKPKEPEKTKLADKPKKPEKPKGPAEKPKEPEKPKGPAEKPKEPEKPKGPAERPKEPEKPKGPAEKPKELEKPRPNGKPHPTPAEKPTPKAPQSAPKDPPQRDVPMVTGHGCPSIFPYEPCCGPCSQGRPGGPCYNGYGRPAWLINNNNYYDDDDNNNYGYNNTNDGTNYGGAYNDFNGLRPCYVRPCDYNYPIGDNTYSSGCTIM